MPGPLSARRRLWTMSLGAVRLRTAPFGEDAILQQRAEDLVLSIDPGLDTLPKLLIHNAAVLGGRPAMRQKDLGIWQTWTWAQMLEEIRAFSVGLAELGL